MSAPFLQKIAALTAERVATAQALRPLQKLRAAAYVSRRPFDFTACLRAAAAPRVIAEIKRASPSQGAIALELDPVLLAGELLGAGAAALSVLTEPHYFGGSPETLREIRAAYPGACLLMKDFVLGEYQLLEARVLGADAALLIHSLLGPEKTRELYQNCLELGLTPFVEVHDEAELRDALSFGAKLVGVNNRNLSTLQVTVETSARLAAIAQGKNTMLVSESGLENPAQLVHLGSLGFDAFLVGTHLLREKTPARSLAALRDLGAQ
jgi:indole-3-glycerol phosphate synthase